MFCIPTTRYAFTRELNSHAFAHILSFHLLCCPAPFHTCFWSSLERITSPIPELTSIFANLLMD